MKASFMLTTQRQNCNLRNGRVLGLQDPKNHVCKKANWRWCWFVLWPRGDRRPGICPTWNDGHCTLLLWCSKNVTWKCAAQETTEMAKPEPHYQPRQCPGSQALSSFAVFGQEQHDSDPPYSPDLAPCDFFLFPKLKLRMKCRKIRHHWRDSRGIAVGIWHNSKKGLPGMLPSMAEMLGPLYLYKRGVL